MTCTKYTLAYDDITLSPLSLSLSLPPSPLRALVRLAIIIITIASFMQIRAHLLVLRYEELKFKSYSSAYEAIQDMNICLHPVCNQEI